MSGRPPLVLASASPRRLDLLARLGCVPDRVDPADLDERPKPAERPAELVRRLADAKAALVAARHPGAVVLAADTLVAVGRRILPKAEADVTVAECLRLISGRRHQVLTAVTLIDAAGRVRARLSRTEIRVRLMSEADIAAYVDSGEGLGKAGGYAIQGRFEAHVPWIKGSYSAVVGLPLAETRALLVAGGLDPLG